MKSLAKMNLVITKRTDINLLKLMSIHYSNPKGFVGRNICYAIYHRGDYYGHIIGGSAIIYLKQRDEYFNIKNRQLNSIVNNIFFHIERVNNQYPYRNFTQSVLNEFQARIKKDWFIKYGDKVIGFETLVEPPRTGEIYLRNRWSKVGVTRGLTCKRVPGIDPTEKYTGIRIWEYTNLRPKIIFCKNA